MEEQKIKQDIRIGANIRRIRKNRPDTVLEDGVAGVKIQDQTGKLEIWLSLSDGTLLQWDHTAVWQPEETLHLWPGEGAEDGN